MPGHVCFGSKSRAMYIHTTVRKPSLKHWALYMPGHVCFGSKSHTMWDSSTYTQSSFPGDDDETKSVSSRG